MIPEVSIIIPCYNQEKFLNHCLQSVYEQTFENWECIIVNDESTDKTEEILKFWVEKDSRIKFFNKNNGGVSAARNFGTERAIGNYIFYLDSDDKFTDEKSLLKIVNQIDTETEIVFGNIYDEFENGNLKPSKLSINIENSQQFSESEVLKTYLEEKIPAVVWNKLYKTSFLKENQFKFEPEILQGEDELFSLQVFMKAKKVKFVNEFTYNYFRSNTTSITANKGERNYNSLIFVMKKISEFAEKAPLKNAEPKSVIRLFEKQYYFLKNPQVLQNKKLWTAKYTEIQHIYKNSVLNNLQKRFVYGANIGYFALKNFQKTTKNSFPQKIFAKFITF